MRPEVLLAAGYALFLLCVAVGLDLLARHSHRRADRYRTAGFTFHHHLDAWECPERQHLERAEVDHVARLIRYRGKPHVCNRCPIKDSCTDSDEGREIVRPMNPWPHSDVGRFHRGLGLALVALAELIVLVELTRHHAAAELLALVPTGALIAFGGVLLGRVFVSTPSGFPEPAQPQPTPVREARFATLWSTFESAEPASRVGDRDLP